jgi:hypothetical protein
MRIQIYQRRWNKMSDATMCKTKAGKGLKIVVDGTWYYTSWGEFNAMLRNDANGCTFRTIDDTTAMLPYGLQ